MQWKIIQQCNKWLLDIKALNLILMIDYQGIRLVPAIFLGYT